MESGVEHVARLYETDFLLDKERLADMIINAVVHLNELTDTCLTTDRRPPWI